MDNIAKDAAAIVAARRVEDQKRQSRDVQEQQERLHTESERATQEQQSSKNAQKRIKLAVSSLGAMLLLMWWTTPPPSLSKPLPGPVAQWDFGVTDNFWVDDIWLRNKSPFLVRNVTLTMSVNSHGQYKITKQLKCPSLPAGETHIWPNEGNPARIHELV